MDTRDVYKRQMIAYAGEDASYMGRTFSGLAHEAGRTMGQTVAQLLYSQKLALSFHDVEPQMTPALCRQFEADVLELLARPCYMVGSLSLIHIWWWAPRRSRLPRTGPCGR